MNFICSTTNNEVLLETLKMVSLNKTRAFTISTSKVFSTVFITKGLVAFVNENVFGRKLNLCV